MGTGKHNDVLIEQLDLTLGELSSRVQEMHPHSAVSLLRTRLTSLLFAYRRYELLDSWLLVGFFRDLLNTWFERRIRLKSGEELEKSSVAPEVTSMMQREFRGLSLDRHFDYDYALDFEKLKDDMTALRQLEKVLSEEEYRNIEFELVKCVSRATDEVLRGLSASVQRLIDVAQRGLREKQTIKALEDSLRSVTQEVHIQIFGWP